MKKEIIKILKENTQSVNSFIDNDGKNHFMDVVDEIDVLLKNRIWEIASDILKSIGVKSIKTTYFKK